MTSSGLDTSFSVWTDVSSISPSVDGISVVVMLSLETVLEVCGPSVGSSSVSFGLIEVSVNVGLSLICGRASIIFRFISSVGTMSDGKFVVDRVVKRSVMLFIVVVILSTRSGSTDVASCSQSPPGQSPEPSTSGSYSKEGSVEISAAPDAGLLVVLTSSSIIGYIISVVVSKVSSSGSLGVVSRTVSFVAVIVILVTLISIGCLVDTAG